MNKKIILSLSVIGLVAAIAIGGTIAYFSDTETSVGNTFTAGTINIKLNPKGGQAVETVSGDLDLKPSQTGWTRSVITNVGTNPAEIWKHIGNVENLEHGIVEPEQKYYNEHDGSENWLMSNWIHYDMEVYKPLEYEAAVTTVPAPWGDFYLAGVTVTQDGCSITWTFDMVGNKQLEGNGHWGYGLVISYDGDDPAFQVHNNDGTDSNYTDGTHLYSEWGPEGTGYNGWHSSDRNTPVSDMDWIEATGDRYYVDNPDGVFTITMNKCDLSETIYWAVYVGVGGFYTPNNGYSMYPVTWTPWSGDASTIVKAEIKTLVKEILEGEGWFLTGGNGVESNWIYLGELEPGECMCVIQSYHLDSTVDNWAQSDRVKFDMDFMAQQTTPLPPVPDSVLPGYGR